MANAFGSYQSAFSMFLATQKDESLDSKGPASSENSKDSNLPDASRSNQLEAMDLSSSFGGRTPSEQSNDVPSNFPNCPSMDSISEQLSVESSTVASLQPQLPPPSEDANQEAVKLDIYDQESMDTGDIPEESVDDTPHFQAAFDRTPEPNANGDSLLSEVALVTDPLPDTPPVSEVDNSSQSGDKNSQLGDKSFESGDKGSESGDKSSESGDKGSESGDKSSESGDKGSESGDRSSESGDKSSQSGDKSLLPEDIGSQSGNKSSESQEISLQEETTSAEPEQEVTDKKDATEVDELPVEEMITEHKPAEVVADMVFEYQWPQETGGDIFMIQEQLSEFLGIVSFKRKYPDLTRHGVDYKEKIFLMDRGAVTETQCDLGLTALRSEEVYELMSKDYPTKYKEYLEALRERERKRISEQNKDYAGMQSIEKAKVDFFVKKAVRSAADFNAQLMREKREERRAYLDLQTLEVHYPHSKIRVVSKETSNPGSYPVALIPGQYQHYYKKYTPQELKYFPIKTALYSPHKVLKSIYADPDDADDVNTTEEEKEKDNASSSSDDSQSGSSDSEPDSIDGESNEVKISEEQIKKLLATPRPDTPPKKQRRKAVPNNTTDAADSEKDSEAGSVKTPRRKTARTPGKRSAAKTPKGRPKGRPPLPQNLQCNICQEVGLQDKVGHLMELAQCSECFKYAHIECLEFTDEMIPVIKTYPWQCMECKTCIKCKDSQDEENMMFCDHCDRGYHTFCVGLKAIPPGRWECPSCQPEAEPTKPVTEVEEKPQGDAAVPKCTPE